MIRCSTARGIGIPLLGSWVPTRLASPLANSYFGPVQTLQSFWFLKSDHLGKVSVGMQSAAADNAAILVDGSGSLVPDNWVMFDNAFLNIRNKVTGQLNGVWGAFGNCFVSAAPIGGDCQATPTNVVRYDSPVFAGFSMSADWGQNGGYWDAYARYAAEYNGIKIAATSGWGQTNTAAVLQTTPLINLNNTSFPVFGLPSQMACNQTIPVPGGTFTGQSTCEAGYWQNGLYIEHVATGLFAYGAYGRHEQPDPGVEPRRGAGDRRCCHVAVDPV